MSEFIGQPDGSDFVAPGKEDNEGFKPLRHIGSGDGYDFGIKGPIANLPPIGVDRGDAIFDSDDTLPLSVLRDGRHNPPREIVPMPWLEKPSE